MVDRRPNLQILSSEVHLLRICLEFFEILGDTDAISTSVPTVGESVQRAIIYARASEGFWKEIENPRSKKKKTIHDLV